MVAATSRDPDRAIRSLLGLAREHLGMDVAFVSELGPARRVFRYVDGAETVPAIRPGGSDPVEDSYCHHVVAGRVPQLLADARTHPVTAGMAATDQLPVGTHLSVPLELSDGTVYGTFCLFSHQVVSGVGERDLALVRMLAAIAADYLEDLVGDQRALHTRREQVAALAAGHGLQVVFQPIVELATGRVAGMEALSRFPTMDGGPAAIFAHATQVGLGTDLELKAVRAALDRLDDLPDGAYMSVNVAAETLADPDLAELVQNSDPSRIVLEITEHTAVHDYPTLRPAVAELTRLGARLAIDDVGAGFAGLDRILQLTPTVLKLDGSLVRDADEQPAKQAMIAALATFADRTATTLVAEQIETDAELHTLHTLQVGYGQGYHLGRPGPLARAHVPADPATANATG